MTLRKTIAFAAFSVAAGCTIGCSMPAKPLIVSCTTDGNQIDIVSLDPSHGQATLLSVSPPLSGQVHVSPTQYEVVFQPGPEGTSRLLLKINRYSFRATRETREPATAAGTHGSQTAGACERYKAKPL
jgi:hypothetical protein